MKNLYMHDESDRYACEVLVHIQLGPYTHTNESCHTCHKCKGERERERERERLLSSDIVLCMIWGGFD